MNVGGDRLERRQHDVIADVLFNPLAIRRGCLLQDAGFSGRRAVGPRLLPCQEREVRAENRVPSCAGGGGRGVTLPLYLIDKGDRRVAYIGSSNFTRGGLDTNLEANVRIEGEADSTEIVQAEQAFDAIYSSEFSVALTPEFEVAYRELQRQQQDEQRYRRADVRGEEERLVAAEKVILGRYRSEEADNRWILVVKPDHYDICMKNRVWGRQKESEIRNYAAGDVFCFHVNGRGIATIEMFTGLPFLDPTPLWPDTNRGIYPWRVRFVPLGEIRGGVPTKAALAHLREGAPSHWFNGFIQKSHSLRREEFEALRRQFELRLSADEDVGASFQY